MLDNFEPGARVLFLEQVVSPHHLETSLDAALQLSLRGHPVRYVHFGKVLPHIEFKKNPLVLLNLAAKLGTITSHLYTHPVSAGIKLASEYVREKRLDADFSIHDSPHLQEPRRERLPMSLLASSLSSLKNYSYDGERVGSALASSLVSSCRSSEVFPWMHPLKLTAIWRSYFLSRQAFEKYGRDWADCLVVFNGRFAFSKGAQHVALESGVRVLFHERGGADQKGFFLEDFQTHDNSKRADYYEELWQAAIQNGEEPQAIAEGFLEKKRDSKLESRENYTKRHLLGRKAAQLEPGTIVYFSSSDDETVSLGDLAPRSGFRNQRLAIRCLIATCVKQERKLVIRVHPNTSSKSLRERLWWGRANPLFWRRNLTFISAKSTVSSYELVDKSEAVVVWRSSIAYESVYWGKPVLALSEAAYLHGGLSASFVSSEKSLTALLKLGNWIRPNPDTALKFAHGAAVSKHSFEFYVPDTSNRGTFLGTNLFSSRSRRRMRK